MNSPLDYTKIPLVFNVYKPPGPSSFRVVYHFKKNLNYDYGKIGHFGTLDPFAKGVLLIGVQGAQKLNDYIHKLLPKTYRAVGVFGKKTQSGDFTSPVTEEREIEQKWREASREDVEGFLCEEFLGEYWQAPHSVSAVKVNGKRLYRHALEGRFLSKEKVKREILDFKVIEYAYPKMEFIVSVSSGTYVRSFFEEVSELFGGAGTLFELERLAIGANSIKEAMDEGHWPKKEDSFDLEKWGKPLDRVLILSQIFLDASLTYKYLQGQRLLHGELNKSEETQTADPDLYWVYGHEEHLLGLAKKVGEELHAVFNLQMAITHYLSTSSGS